MSPVLNGEAHGWHCAVGLPKRTRTASLDSTPKQSLFAMNENSYSSPDASDPEYTGGDGRTLESAVVIENVRSHAAGIRAEKQYISQQIREGEHQWVLHEQVLLERDDGTRVDRLTVESSSGETETFYFDVSNFFGMGA